MNIWHDIDEKRITPDEFVAVIEIAKGSKKKYELDKETGLIKLDRILHTSTMYPANYGFIPKTLSGDGDPLDVLVLSSEALDPLVLVKCYPVGMMIMLDDGHKDEKIIAIPCNDPLYNEYKALNSLPRHIADEMINFFRVYKDASEGVTEVEGLPLDAEDAKLVIAEAKQNYRNKFN
ncbi:MAG TPA: inorganic pyrophosphatase [Clostridiales bacterium]|nr:inorganic pyrophosphatase [Clostridiales bacterium]